MANVAKHKFHSAKADFADTSLVRPSNWNDEHVFSGGTDGQVLMRNSAASDGASWADLIQPIEVSNFATAGIGTSGNPWTGWDTAIDWTLIEKVYHARAGYYQFSQGVVIPNERVRFLGDGFNTRFRFNPTSGGADPVLGRVAFTLGAVGHEIFWCDFGNFNLYSTDTTFVKTGIQVIDISGSIIHDIIMGDSGWHDTSFSSIGFYMQGRDTTVVYKNTFGADRCMVLRGSPNADIDTDNRNLDSMTFRDHYLISHPASPHPCIEILPDTWLSSVYFEGFTACNRGTHGLYWTRNPAATYTSQVNRFNNIRWEQQVGTAGYIFYADLRGNAFGQNLMLTNIHGGGAANGIYLRGFFNVNIDNLQFIGGVGQIACDINGVQSDAGVFTGVYPVTFRNCFAQTGSTFNYTAQAVVVDQAPQGQYPITPGPFPTTSWFVVDIPRVVPTTVVPTVFTPALVGSTATSGANTYTVQIGYYELRGRLLTFEARVVIDNWNVAGTTGSIALSGLPVAAWNLTNLQGSITIGKHSGVTLTAGYTQLGATISPGNIGATFQQCGSGVAAATLTSAAFTTGSEICLSGFFYIAP